MKPIEKKSLLELSIIKHNDDNKSGIYKSCHSKVQQAREMVLIV